MAVFVDPDPDTLVEILDGEAVLLSLRTEHFHALDPTGTALWLALDEHGCPQRAAEVVADRHAVPVERVRQDIDVFVAELSQRGLLRVTDG